MNVFNTVIAAAAIFGFAYIFASVFSVDAMAICEETSSYSTCVRTLQ